MATYGVLDAAGDTRIQGACSLESIYDHGDNDSCSNHDGYADNNEEKLILEFLRSFTVSSRHNKLETSPDEHEYAEKNKEITRYFEECFNETADRINLEWVF